MNRRLHFSYRDIYWATLGALLVLIVIAVALLVNREYQGRRLHQQQAAQQELNFLAELVTQSLANEQYHLAELLIDRWGREHRDTVFLALETPDGFVLARYTGSADSASDRYVIERRLEPGNARSALLKLEVDLRLANVAARQYAWEIAGGAAVLVLVFGQFLLLLDRSRQQRILALQAHQDGLTGIANRRRFDDALASEWRRARRDQSSLALIMVDVDAFKAFNDALGHQAGDDCLRRVAETLAGQVARPADLVARYGGEEFAVLLPATDLVSAMHLAEAMRAAVAQLAISHPKARAGDHVTVSLGVAAMVPLEDELPSELVAHADHLLYLAKHAGGNRAMGNAHAGPRAAAV